MALSRVDKGSGHQVHSATITTAGTVLSGTVIGLSGALAATVQAAFTYGSSGGTALFYVQNSVDGGTNWFDVAAFSFTNASGVRLAAIAAGGGTAIITPTDGSLTAGAVNSTLLGSSWRVKQVTTGTYAGSTSIAIHLVTRD